MSSSDDANVYEVEKIIAHRDIAQSRIYFVKWVGYPDNENSWVEEPNMGCTDLLEEYLKSVQQKNQKALDDYHNNVKPDYVDLLSDDIQISKILNGHRSQKGIYYKVQYSDNTIHYVASDCLKKFFPYLLYEFLKPRIRTVNDSN